MSGSSKKKPTAAVVRDLEDALKHIVTTLQEEKEYLDTSMVMRALDNGRRFFDEVAPLQFEAHGMQICLQISGLLPGIVMYNANLRVKELSSILEKATTISKLSSVESYIQDLKDYFSFYIKDKLMPSALTQSLEKLTLDINAKKKVLKQESKEAARSASPLLSLVFLHLSEKGGPKSSDPGASAHPG